MFDYDAFEHAIVQQMITVFQQWIAEYDDIYSFSLDCTREMHSIGVIANTTQYLAEQTQADREAYWYYKYCEEEWALFDTFQTISETMQKYNDATEDIFLNPQTNTYTEAFDKHCKEIVRRCQNALKRFRKEINPKYADVLLTLQIRDYLDCDEKAEILQAINTETAYREYMTHITDFA